MMGRRDEYLALLKELEPVPAALDGTVERAVQRRAARRRAGRFLGIPAGSLAACFVGFILLVNLFPPFAKACGDVPVLRELAKAVAWSPSLSAAVENDYVQPMEQTQTKDGITVSVEYLIVDRKQLNIFYTLRSKEYSQLEADAHIHLEVEENGSFSCGSGSYGTPNGELRSVRADFIERDIPGTIELELSVWAPPAENEAPQRSSEDDAFQEPEGKDTRYLADFTFSLSFILRYTAQGQDHPGRCQL